MQGVPPLHRILDDRDIHHTDNRKHRTGLGCTVTITDRLAQRNNAEVQEQQDEHGRKAGIPHPPAAPGRLAPDRPGDQRHGGHPGTDGRRALQGDVGQFHLPHQCDDAAHRQHHVDGLRQHGGRNVDIDDAEAVALLVVRRREGQAPDHANADQQQRRDAQPGQHFAADAVKPFGRAELVKPRPVHTVSITVALYCEERGSLLVVF
ncbi:hypothetical protein D9M73_183950 [compost metagenome]